MHRGSSFLPGPRPSRKNRHDGSIGRHTPSSIVVLGVLALLSSLASVRAEDEPSPSEESPQVDEARAKRLQQMTAHAAEYELWGGEDEQRAFKRADRPVLRWSNPQRATADGGLFLWSDKNRPAAVLCIYKSGEDQVDHEWQSLSTAPFRATYRGATAWQPRTAGVEFRRLPGKSELAAATPVRRLAQLHRLLNDFSGSLGREERKHELRALTQPIYRYADEDSDVVDGAVFALTQGTDPEILLLFEARRAEGQPLTWWWAAARMSMVPLELKYRDELVWTVDWRRQRDERGPCITLVRPWLEP
ncbi:MAG TPA: hypothetical protein VHC22_17120 [Pirellulales bacterium]|nr:hypothetical protein [Pirellulales bacterium]